MQSSPQMRATENAPSPSESQYSLDLSLLDLGSHDSEASPLPTQRIDQVLSEDIDGPSDFTVNMEKWMRGGTLGKGTKMSAKSPLPSFEGQEAKTNDGVQNQHFKALASSESNEASLHGKAAESRQAPSHTTPGESVLSDRLLRIREQQLKSDWDPYDEATAPQPPVHRQFMQPTVEEYHSEIILGRPPVAHTSHSCDRETVGAVNRRQSQAMRRSISPERPSRPTLSPIQSQPVQSSLSSKPEHDNSPEQQLQTLQSRCQQLEQLNSAFQKALDEEQRDRRLEKTTNETQMAKAARRERHLAEMQDEASRRAEGFRTQFEHGEARLRMLELHAGRHGDEIARLNEIHAVDLQSLRTEMQRRRAADEQKLRAVRADFEKTDDGAMDAEHAAGAPENLYSDRSTHGAELDRLRHTSHQAGESCAHTIESLKDVRDVSTSVQADLAGLKQAQKEGEAAHIVNDYGSAIDLVQNLQRKLTDVHQQSREKEAALDDLESLRIDLEAKQALLNEAILERDAAQDSFNSLQSEFEALKLKLKDSETVSQALGAKISDAIGRREAYWRSRLEQSERERQTMANALLHQWGREETGTYEPQRYQYKYISHALPAKAGA